MTNQS